MHKPSYHELYSVAYLPDPLILGRPDALDIPLNFLHHADEFHQFPPEKADLLLDVGHVLVVNLLQGLEGVA